MSLSEEEEKQHKYNSEDWEECTSVGHKQPGYWEALNDGSGRIRFWRIEKNEAGGSWTVDLPPDHPRRILRSKTRTPFFCPVCQQAMRDYHRDAKCFRLIGCCHWCEIDFVEGFEQEWKDGWRPGEEALQKAKDKRPVT